jgi:hypothetical protein
MAAAVLCAIVLAAFAVAFGHCKLLSPPDILHILV